MLHCATSLRLAPRDRHDLGRSRRSALSIRVARGYNGRVSDDARVRELEEKLARTSAALVEFSAALGRERAERERAARERDEYRKLYELVMLELERVKRHLRAQNKSEKVDAQQVQIAFAEIAKLIVPPEIAQAIADQENEEQSKADGDRERAKTRGRHGRGPIPEHLPTERIEIDVPEALRSCPCCGKSKVKIGEETCDRLDYRPASLVHLHIARIKYAPACKCQEGGVVIASVPDAAPVDRGLAGPGLLAHVVVSKYGDHLPLHRLEEGFDRQGVHIARSTMCDWVEQVADLLRPITDAMAIAALTAHRIHTDDTGIPILAPGSTHKGHVWVYVPDDDCVLFRYTPRRKSDGPREFLRGYTGYIQADAANLYDRLFGDAEGAGEDEAAKEVGCWAHYLESAVIQRADVFLGASVGRAGRLGIITEVSTRRQGTEGARASVSTAPAQGARGRPASRRRRARHASFAGCSSRIGLSWRCSRARGSHG
jgi:transposase